MPDDTVPTPPRPPAVLLQRARDYIAAAEWTFAKTMADNPHWYSVRQRSRAAGLGQGHEALYVLLRDHHYDRWWHGRTYRSLDLDGFSYWIMEDGTVISRKPTDDAGWDQPPGSH